MTEGVSSDSVPAPARGGLQQVTGEMRKALQRMVFSSESQPVFLDTIPSIDAVVDRPPQSKAPTEKTVSKTISKKQTVKRPTRLGVRTPQWRPGVHTPSPLGRYGRRSSAPAGRGTSGSGTTQDPASVSTRAAGPSIVPNAAPMTMLQAEETPQVSDRSASSTSSENNATVQPANRAKVERTEVSGRKKIQRGRSSTVAPLSLMGRSDVGVFLQPKRKGPES